MSRVHCVGCGAAVVVDPQGVCPEGHRVGSRGARVEAAMGTATEHPDEPEPWVYLIDDTADAMVGARAKGHQGAPSRELRPVRLAGLSTDSFDDVPADADALLRELHSLASLDERVPPPPPPAGAMAPPTDVPVPPAATPPPAPEDSARPSRLDRDAMYNAFAELSALDAFADELANPTTPRGHGPAATNGHGPERDGSRPVNGHTANGHTANGHTANGHTANGHTANGHTANGHTANGHTANGHTANAVNGASRADASPAAGDSAFTHDAEELTALFSSELGSAPAPAPETVDATEATPRMDQLDELFSAAVSAPKLRPRDRAAQDRAPTAPDTVPSPDAAVPATQEAPTAPSVSPAPDTPARQDATPDVAGDPPAAPAALDLSSFTAKGGTGRKAGRKRLFGH